VLADARRVDLLLAQDEAIADGLVAGALGPLDALPAAQRVRLEETLDAWLRHQGEVRVAAAELHVHAQTVRYRLGRLRDLLGARIATADGRLELELALRARRLCAAREGARVSR
jgi:DNA-binding PucR family transcriptional regulator